MSIHYESTSCQMRHGAQPRATKPPPLDDDSNTASIYYFKASIFATAYILTRHAYSSFSGSEGIRVYVLLSPLRIRRIDTRLFRVNILNHITVFGRRSDHSLRIAGGWETASHASMLPLPCFRFQ